MGFDVHSTKKVVSIYYIVATSFQTAQLVFLASLRQCNAFFQCADTLHIHHFCHWEMHLISWFKKTNLYTFT